MPSTSSSISSKSTFGIIARNVVAAGLVLACSPPPPQHAPPFPSLKLVREFQPYPTSDTPVPKDSTVEDAAEVVEGMTTGFQACYQAALNHYGSFSGRVRFALLVGMSGSIVRVTAVGTNVPRDVIDCCFVEIERHRFEPPTGNIAVVDIPLNLKP